MDNDVIVMTKPEAERLKTFLYHTIDPETQKAMMAIRRRTIQMALQVMRAGTPTREASLALTKLEEAQMRAIQDLAMRHGTVELPEGVEIE